MGLAVVTVASGGMPVTDNTANGLGTPVTEAANGLGIAVTKVTPALGTPNRAGGMPVVYVTPPL